MKWPTIHIGDNGDVMIIDTVIDQYSFENVEMFLTNYASAFVDEVPMVLIKRMQCYGRSQTSVLQPFLQKIRALPIHLTIDTLHCNDVRLIQNACFDGVVLRRVVFTTLIPFSSVMVFDELTSLCESVHALNAKVHIHSSRMPFTVLEKMVDGIIVRIQGDELTSVTLLPYLSISETIQRKLHLKLIGTTHPSLLKLIMEHKMHVGMFASFKLCVHIPQKVFGTFWERRLLDLVPKCSVYSYIDKNSTMAEMTEIANRFLSIGNVEKVSVRREVSRVTNVTKIYPSGEKRVIWRNRNDEDANALVTLKKQFHLTMWELQCCPPGFYVSGFCGGATYWKSLEEWNECLKVETEEE
jgi:hypothetical protein